MKEIKYIARAVKPASGGFDMWENENPYDSCEEEKYTFESDLIDEIYRNSKRSNFYW